MIKKAIINKYYVKKSISYLKEKTRLYTTIIDAIMTPDAMISIIEFKKGNMFDKQFDKSNIIYKNILNIFNYILIN